MLEIAGGIVVGAVVLFIGTVVLGTGYLLVTKKF